MAYLRHARWEGCAESRHASASLRVPVYGKVPSLRDDADVAMHRTLAHTDGWWFFAMHRAVGAYQWMAVLSMGDVDGWQEVFMQNYSCGDCFEVMAFRYFFL